MSNLESWSKIKKRISNFQLILERYPSSLIEIKRPEFGSLTDAMENIVKQIRKRIIPRITDFEINKKVEDALRNIYESDNKYGIVQPLTTDMLRTGLTTFNLIETELDEYFEDATRYLISQTDLALEHLKRRIVMNRKINENDPKLDHDLNYWKWELNENSYELLLADHLLMHHIWTAKINMKGAITDLVTQDSISDATDTKYAGSKGLILTEIKVLKEGTDPTTKIKEAMTQLKEYLKTYLSQNELILPLCYIIIISKENIEIETPDLYEMGFTFRIVNIACSPLSPSKVARSRK